MVPWNPRSEESSRLRTQEVGLDKDRECVGRGIRGSVKAVREGEVA